MYSCSFQQLSSLFTLVALGFFPRVWTVATPLLTFEKNLDAGAFPLVNFATEADDERFDVGEDDRRRCGLGEDGLQCFALFGVHWRMLAESDIKCKRLVLASGVALSSLLPGNDVRHASTAGCDLAALNETVRRSVRKGVPMHIFHKPGPCRFVIWLHLSAQGLSCEVKAPSAIPKRSDDRINGPA
jgi:hypothetical protein